MAIQVTGNPNHSFVKVDCPAGQWVRHTITLTSGATANFALLDHFEPSALCAWSGPTPPSSWTANWHPTKPDGSGTIHVLQLVFPTQNTVYGWKVELMNPAGNVVNIIRDIHIAATGATLAGESDLDVFIEPVCI